jgi:hypothetical protein
MGFQFVVSQAQRWMSEHLKPGDITIDATAGNGADTHFLAQAVGSSGFVYAFDIQAAALENTRKRLDEAGVTRILAPVALIHAGHESMDKQIPTEHHGEIAGIMFNLGYLPGAAQDIITQSPSTILALEIALRLLCSGGLMTIVVYPGHEGGHQEAAAVYDWASELSPSVAQTVVYRFLQKPGAPYLVALTKRSNKGN